MTVSIWAPHAKRIELVIEGGDAVELTRGERDAFSCARQLPVGTRYWFRVDGAGPFPDPRSEFQPEGVHGPSQKCDLTFSFSDSEFVAKKLDEAVIYELHVGTFSTAGTFLGAIEHLDALVDLGVTHIELMPVAAFPGNHGWGYDGVAPFAPHAAYGTPEELARLIDEAHARGLAVLLDVVFNHLGPDGNYLGLYAPYFTDRYKTPWGQAVNLDGAESDLVRELFIECALHWLGKYRFDGLRLDAVHAMYDQSAVHFLEELQTRVQGLSASSGRSLVLIAECDLNDPRFVRPIEKGGFGLDAQWCDDFHHSLHCYFTGETDGYYEDYGSLASVARALEQGYVFDGAWSPHRRRPHGRPPLGIGNEQLVVCIQNHDQIGNRARGERLSSLVAPAALMQMAALHLLSPFVPMLFQGEEWGTKRPFLYFTDHQDARLARNVTEGRRREFGYFSSYEGDVPDPQGLSTFEASKLDWNVLQQDEHRKVLDWYKKLLELRAEHSLGKDRHIQVHFDEEKHLFVLERSSVVAYFNFSDDVQNVADRSLGISTDGDSLDLNKNLLAHFPGKLDTQESSLDQLPAHSVVILHRRP